MWRKNGFRGQQGDPLFVLCQDIQSVCIDHQWGAVILNKPMHCFHCFRVLSHPNSNTDSIGQQLISDKTDMLSMFVLNGHYFRETGLDDRHSAFGQVSRNKTTSSFQGCFRCQAYRSGLTQAAADDQCMSLGTLVSISAQRFQQSPDLFLFCKMKAAFSFCYHFFIQPYRYDRNIACIISVFRKKESQFRDLKSDRFGSSDSKRCLLVWIHTARHIDAIYRLSGFIDAVDYSPGYTCHLSRESDAEDCINQRIILI